MFHSTYMAENLKTLISQPWNLLYINSNMSLFSNFFLFLAGYHSLISLLFNSLPILTFFALLSPIYSQPELTHLKDTANLQPEKLLECQHGQMLKEHEPLLHYVC